MAIWAITKIAGKGMEWTLATGIAVGILLVVFVIVAILVLPKFRKMQILTDNLTKVARENLTGLSVVHAYNAAPFQEAKFEKANDTLMRTHRFTGIGFAVIWPTINLVVMGLSLSIFWIAAYLIDGASDQMQRLDYGLSMMVFMQYAAQVIMAFMFMTMAFIMLPRAAVSGKRINEVLSTKTTITGGTVTKTDTSGNIEFKNVSFKYPGALEYVIHDVSFEAKQGETIAVIGGTGSGKSTIVNLIPRFFDASTGEILINGVNIRDFDLGALRDRIGHVAQKATIFNGSVKDNVGFGSEDIDDERVNEALKIAQAKPFVDKMENGINADISRGGKNISGGQKQRISIARAIYKKPEIMIFDDSFSALDYKTDKQLRAALKKELVGTTNIIVAQRIGTIMNADKIIVLENGGICGAGTHRELLGSCAVYREIVRSQLTEDEMGEMGE
jgi:ATP-binding cassette subfamily B protein